jgi:hypothetical protein
MASSFWLDRRLESDRSRIEGISRSLNESAIRRLSVSNLPWSVDELKARTVTLEQQVTVDMEQALRSLQYAHSHF